jgi:sterol desaturase/sphingolipid hydroxylase (fatty acid hydroxylase superfamily)
MELFEALGRMMTGTSGFAIYWGILIAVASLELAMPGRRNLTAVGPRLMANIGLGLLSAALLSLPMLSEVALAVFVQSQRWGLSSVIALPEVAKVLATFLIYDLFGYSLHRLSHHWHPLWRLHRVHHSDPEIDLSTVFRSHPLDALIGVGLRLGLIVTLGLHPLGIVLQQIAQLFTMGLGHANVVARPRLSRIFGLFFVTPAFHARHHSAWQPQTNSNYGQVLTVWDRLLGSCSENSGAVDRFGLGDRYDHDASKLGAQLKLPFISR